MGREILRIHLVNVSGKQNRGVSWEEQNQWACPKEQSQGAFPIFFWINRCMNVTNLILYWRITITHSTKMKIIGHKWSFCDVLLLSRYSKGKISPFEIGWKKWKVLKNLPSLTGSCKYCWFLWLWCESVCVMPMYQVWFLPWHFMWQIQSHRESLLIPLNMWPRGVGERFLYELSHCLESELFIMSPCNIVTCEILLFSMSS